MIIEEQIALALKDLIVVMAFFVAIILSLEKALESEPYTEEYFMEITNDDFEREE